MSTLNKIISKLKLQNMQQKTNGEQGELLNSQLGSEETHKENSRILTNDPIDNTPFRLVGKEEKYFIALGRTRLTQYYETEEGALSAIYDKHWEIILHMIVTVLEGHIQLKKATGEVMDIPE